MDLNCLSTLSFLLLITVIVFLIYLGKKMTGKAWGEFAKSEGLSIKSEAGLSCPKVTGNYRGFNYSLYTSSKPVFEKGKASNAIYTGITIELPENPRNFYFNIYNETWLTKIATAIEGEDVKLGDQGFDESFVIKSNSPELIRKIFTQDLRRMLMMIGYTNISLCGNKINYEERGILNNLDNIKNISEIMWQLAKNISE